MKPLKAVKAKGGSKRAREARVLLGLVELYIRTSKPIGSHTLKDADFHDLSSATLRNYFSRLEEAGYLRQLPVSGG